MARQRSQFVVDHVGGQGVWRSVVGRQHANLVSQGINRLLHCQSLAEPVNEQPSGAEFGNAQTSPPGRHRLQNLDSVSRLNNLLDRDQPHRFGTCSALSTFIPYPAMKFFTDSRGKRNTALVVLLVWLFALASSVANACSLEKHQPHSTVTGDALATASHAPANLLSKMSIEVGHHDDSDAGRESCLKACDDRTRTLPEANSGVYVADPGPALLVTTLWIASQLAVPAPRRVDDRAVPMVGPSLRPRYSRLARLPPRCRIRSDRVPHSASGRSGLHPCPQPCLGQGPCPYRVRTPKRESEPNQPDAYAWCHAPRARLSPSTTDSC